MSWWKRSPWINLWMAGFSIAGIWLIASSIASHSHASLADEIIGIVIYVIVFSVAFWRLPSPLLPQPDETQLGGMGEIVDVYVRAWQKLWSEKWILRLFGVIALIGALDSLYGSWITGHFMASRGGGLYHPLSVGSYLTFLMSTLTNRTINSWSFFHLTIGIRQSLGMVAALALVILLTSSLKLKRRAIGLASDPQIGRTARRVASAMTPAMIVAVVISIWAGASSIIYIRSLHSSAGPSSHWLMFVPSMLWYLLLNVFVRPLFFGGFLGSLQRSGRQEAVTVDSFLKDGITHLPSLFQYFLLLLIIPFVYEIVPSLSFLLRPDGPYIGFPSYAWTFRRAFDIFTLFLIFVPYVIVMSSCRLLPGMRSGLRLWFRKAGDVVSFLALGTTLVVTLLIVEDVTVHMMFAPLSPFLAIIGSIWAVITAALAAYMAVAVWELYRYISDDNASEACL
jgi:hypothetical protein